jgi:hypothetical protein
MNFFSVRYVYIKNRYYLTISMQGDLRLCYSLINKVRISYVMFCFIWYADRSVCQFQLWTNKEKKNKRQGLQSTKKYSLSPIIDWRQVVFTVQNEKRICAWVLFNTFSLSRSSLKRYCSSNVFMPFFQQ